jgi:hypothetical protein
MKGRQPALLVDAYHIFCFQLMRITALHCPAPGQQYQTPLIHGVLERHTIAVFHRVCERHTFAPDAMTSITQKTQQGGATSAGGAAAPTANTEQPHHNVDTTLFNTSTTLLTSSQQPESY